MNKSIVSLFLIITITAYIVPSNGEAETTATTEVVVLALRHLNFDMNGFKNMDAKYLTQMLTQLKPDIIAAELNQEWLHEFKNGKAAKPINDAIASGEYGKVVFPLAKEHGWEIEGIGAESFDESNREKTESSKLRATPFGEGSYESFNRFIEIFYAIINRDFRTFTDVNSLEYDRLMEMKHTFQSKIKYHYWETRNKKMAQNICDLAVKYPGKRILVTIGSEHGYAIRQELASCKNVVQLTFSQVISAQK